MLETILNYLGAARYAEHSICLTNDPTMIFLFVSGDLVTGSAYMLIAGSLFLRVRRNQAIIVFDRQSAGLYGAFILLCGFSHYSSVLTMFTGIYRLDVAITAMMAVVSGFTAFITWCDLELFPQAEDA